MQAGRHDGRRPVDRASTRVARAPERRAAQHRVGQTPGARAVDRVGDFARASTGASGDKAVESAVRRARSEPRRRLRSRTQLARCASTSRSTSASKIAKRLEQPSFDVGDARKRQLQRASPAVPLRALDSAITASTAPSASQTRGRVLDADERYEAVQALRGVASDARLGKKLRAPAPCLGRREAVMDHPDVVSADLEDRKRLVDVREKRLDRLDRRPRLLAVDEAGRLVRADEHPTAPRHRGQHPAGRSTRDHRDVAGGAVDQHVHRAQHRRRAVDAGRAEQTPEAVARGEDGRSRLHVCLFAGQAVAHAHAGDAAVLAQRRRSPRRGWPAARPARPAASATVHASRSGCTVW